MGRVARESKYKWNKRVIFWVPHNEKRKKGDTADEMGRRGGWGKALEQHECGRTPFLIATRFNMVIISIKLEKY